MFECLARNLLQISPLKLCFGSLIYFLNMFSECRKCYFRDPNLKKFLAGGIPQTPLANSCLRYSAHTFGDWIISWERARREWALWQGRRKHRTIGGGTGFQGHIRILKRAPKTFSPEMLVTSGGIFPPYHTEIARF